MHHRWLDELIVALWHDLQCYLDWKAQDSELLRAGAKPASQMGQPAGDMEGTLVGRRGSKDSAAQPQLSAGA